MVRYIGGSLQRGSVPYILKGQAGEYSSLYLELHYIEVPSIEVPLYKECGWFTLPSIEKILKGVRASATVNYKENKQERLKLRDVNQYLALNKSTAQISTEQ